MRIAAVLALSGTAYGATAPEIRIEPTALYFGAAQPAASAASAGPKQGLAKEDLGGLPAPGVRPEVLQSLRDKAARQGSVRVLVRLSTAFTPEGRLDTARASGQRQAISQAQDSAVARLAGTSARVNARYQRIPFLALEVDAGALDRLATLPGVVGIEEDVFHRPSLASSTAVIGAGVAWAGGLTGTGQTIAVLDTGVDKTHPFFSSGGHSKVVSEACYSSVFPNSSIASLCPGGVLESTSPGSGLNCTAAAADDGCSHGTHVAGIAAGNDGVGPNFGVARDAGLISIQVFSIQYGYYLGAFTSDIIKGLERVYALADQFDIAAVNLSLGGGLYASRSSCDNENPALKAAIDNLRSIDIATVAASGNDYYFDAVAAPACISSAVGVGATNDADHVAFFSNSAPFLDLVAPGVSVTSSVPGGGTATYNGTSMAAPHVAGAWAVLKQASPSATVPDILALLRNTAVSVQDFGNDLRRINLGRAALGGPFVTQEFTIYNDGTAVLSVLSMQLESLVPWIRWSPEAPFDVPPGGSRKVAVSVDFGAIPQGPAANRLIVASTDADESPYPDAVHLFIDKQPCYPLTRTRTGNGGYAELSPTSSPGCPGGQFHAGAAIQLKSLPATGWAVQSWSGTDNDASTAATNTLTMPASPHTVSLTYFAQCYALTLTHTGSGGDPVASPASSPGCPAGQYKYAEAVQLTAEPARGWRVGSWTNTANDASFGKTNSLRMPAGPRTVSVSYLEGVPGVLLVDNNPYSFDNRSSFTSALDALGAIYHVWDVSQAGRPSAADLAQYPRVVWYGDIYSSPLSEADESVLASYLNQGGGLFLPALEYLDFRGLTPFAASYLGVSSYSSNYYSSSEITGQGSAFGGLGPYGLAYPSYYDADSVSPAAGAETAFTNGSTGLGVNYTGPNYRTVFLSFDFANLVTPEARRDVMGAALDFTGTVFADVPRGHWAKKWVEAIYRNGVTQGCGLSPRLYCPESEVTRQQMAVFLLKSKEGSGYTPPPCTTSPFNDVPASSGFCPWVQELVARGITHGCGGGNFCPNMPVTREQMAYFLLVTLEGTSYAPPPCTDTPFPDVPAGSGFCPWIQELVLRGLTSGCGNGKYCPADPVNRAQAATFLVRTFHLPLFF
ncbi:MAG TPA: S8 family serine peptidase [Thermoanaerobaculia bacterium]|nr:S8 family serine peptidase [Thermoanaerobaculia bacterium]